MKTPGRFTQLIPLVSGSASLPFGFVGLERGGAIYFGCVTTTDAEGPCRIKWRLVENEFSDSYDSVTN